MRRRFGLTHDGQGHCVTGVDVHALPGVTERVDRFIEADLDRGLPVSIDDEDRY